MKEINNYITEKLVIDKDTKNVKVNPPIFDLVQYENNKEKGGYSTFDIETAKEYKYCFVECNKLDDFICIHVLNDFEEYSETSGWDDIDVKALSKLNIGDSVKIQTGGILTKLW